MIFSCYTLLLGNCCCKPSSAGRVRVQRPESVIDHFLISSIGFLGFCSRVLRGISSWAPLAFYSSNFCVAFFSVFLEVFLLGYFLNFLAGFLLKFQLEISLAVSPSTSLRRSLPLLLSGCHSDIFRIYPGLTFKISPRVFFFLMPFPESITEIAPEFLGSVIWDFSNSYSSSSCWDFLGVFFGLLPGTAFEIPGVE